MPKGDAGDIFRAAIQLSRESVSNASIMNAWNIAFNINFQNDPFCVLSHSVGICWVTQLCSASNRQLPDISWWWGLSDEDNLAHSVVQNYFESSRAHRYAMWLRLSFIPVLAENRLNSAAFFSLLIVYNLILLIAQLQTVFIYAEVSRIWELLTIWVFRSWLWQWNQV